MRQPLPRLTAEEKRKIKFHDELIEKSREPSRVVRRGEDDNVEIPGILVFGCRVCLKK